MKAQMATRCRPVAWGLAALPEGPDRICRDELAEYVRVLCLELHGTTSGACPDCAALISPAGGASVPPVGEHHLPFWAAAVGLLLVAAVAPGLLVVLLVP